MVPVGALNRDELHINRLTVANRLSLPLMPKPTVGLEEDGAE